MPMNGWMRVVYAVALCLLGVCGAPTTFAQSTYALNLPEQSLADSLRTIGQQTATNILFEPGTVKDVRSVSLRGTYSVDDAIRILLKGTKLEAQHTAASNIVVKVKSARGATGSAAEGPINPQQEGRKNSSQDFRVAQVHQGATGPSAVEKSKERESKKTPGLEEIVVTGSRIPT